MFDLEISFYILLFTYVTIAYELLVLPVPSVASTYQLFFIDKADSTVKQRSKDSLLQTVRRLPIHSKTVLLFVPTAVSVINYCFPLTILFLPNSWWQQIHIEALEQGWIEITAVSLIVIGRVLALSSVVRIRSQNSQKNEDFDLKTEGFFGYSRNPILMGMYITYWGIFLLLPNIITLAGFLIYATNMHFRILLEEDFLADLFEDKFLRYKEKTRRYL